MFRSLCLLLTALACDHAPAIGAEAARWEIWDNCRFEADKYFDGDSFHVAHNGGSEIVRLYFVDAPETDAGYGRQIDEQAAYFRVSKTAVLKSGSAAREFTAKFLSKPFRVITSRRIAPGASRSDRYYAVIQRDETRLDSALVESGLARATGEVAAWPDEAGGLRAMQQLRALEQSAVKKKAGIWANSGTRVDSVVNAVKTLIGKSTEHRINLNTASSTELESLPGIGPKIAEQIIRARPLKDIGTLDAVPGIGPKKIEAMRGLVSF